MSDQFAGLHAIVIPGTLRDSLVTLDGLLELDPPGADGPTMIITDQASYSDQVFGLFWLLGYQFSPRPGGLPDQRFWRIDRHADYGPLGGLARNRINPQLIITHWDDILRVVGSLSTGTVRASEVFGWHINNPDSDRPSFDDPGGRLSGAWVSDHLVANEPGLLPYIYVDHIDDTITRILPHGGKIVTDPFPEGLLTVATFRDPAGNVIGLWHDGTR